MSLSFGIGFSKEPDALIAAKDAAFESKTKLEQDNIDLALVFSSIHYDPKITLPTINKILNNSKVIGCSTAGIIQDHSVEARGILVLTLTSDEVKFGAGLIDEINIQDTLRAGSLLAKSALEDFGKHNRQAFLFFADGYSENNSSLLKGIQEVLGNVFPILGGCSCDNFLFEKSFQLFYNQVLQHAAVGLIIGGHVSIGVGGRHGWKPLGKPRIVTSATENIIHTIDGKKASSLYDEFFGKDAASLRSTQFGQMSILYPLGLYVEGSDEYLLRNAIDILTDGSISCQGAIQEGAEIHVMIGNQDSARQAATEAAQEAKKNLFGKRPKLIIIIESMARLKLLRKQSFKEIAQIKAIFEDTVPVVGMYAHGEVCPMQTTERFKKHFLQNESIVVLAIG